MTADKSILEKIRACLALGDKDRNPNANEAETAIAMAKKLMAAHNLSMADVAFSEANVGKIREESLTPRSGVPKWPFCLLRRHCLDACCPGRERGATTNCQGRRKGTRPYHS